MVVCKRIAISLRVLPILLLVLSSLTRSCFATDRFYSDFTVESENGRYKLTVKSPDNANPDEHVPFQAGFHYVLRDLSDNKLLWKRDQPKGEQIELGEGKSLQTWKEGSPQSAFVHADGWCVLWLENDEIVVVRKDGTETGRLDVIEKGFAEDERESFVHFTTAGQMWGARLCYFIAPKQDTLFVIRTWWGRRIVFNLARGEMTNADDEIAAACKEWEQKHVHAVLQAATQDKAAIDGYQGGLLMAIQMAGKEQMRDCEPQLHKLEDAPYIGSSTMRPFLGEVADGDVDFNSWNTYTLRQAVQLSLRRLGVAPRPFPAIEFSIAAEKFDDQKPYVPPLLEKPRAAQAIAIVKGMQPKEVMSLIGAPDFVDSDMWEYDMDAKIPFTLIVRWEKNLVTSVEQQTPAAWQKGHRRDSEIMF